MYLEHLAFVIKKAGWKVTKIHAHLTFEQKRFKKKFFLMNQKSRQESKNNIEKDFYKLMNNSNFVTTDLIKQDIEKKYNNKLIKLDKEDKFYVIKLNTINYQRLSDLEAAENFEKKEKKKKVRLNLVNFSERKSEALRNQKVEALIDFDEECSSSIKSLAIKQSDKVNLTTRYLNVAYV